MAYFDGFYSILAAGTALTTSRFSGGWPNKIERLLNSQQDKPIRVIQSGNDRQTSDRGVELLPSWAGMRTDAALLEFAGYDSDTALFPGGIGNPYRASPPEAWLPGDLGAKLTRWFRGNVGMLQTCGWSPDDKHSSITVTPENEFAATFNSSGWRNARGAFGRSSGKYYLEFKVNGSSPTHGVGLAATNAPLQDNHIGVSPHGILILCSPAMFGQVFTNNTLASDYWTTNPVASMTVQLAVDLTAKKVWAKKVGDSLWNNSGTADPATGVGGYDISTIEGTVYPAWSVSSSGASVVLNPGVYAWAGAIPSGFAAWNSELLVPVTDTRRIAKWVDQSDNTVPRRLDSYNKHADLSVTSDGLGVSRTGTSAGSGQPVTARGYEVMPSVGKHYFEYAVTGGSAILAVGFTDALVNSANTLSLGQSGSYSLGYWSIDGTVRIGGTTVATLLAYTTGDTIGVAVDFDAKLIWFRKGAGGDWNNNPANSPATGVGGISFASVYTKSMLHAVSITSHASVVTLNFGATAYSGTAPAGFGNVPNPKASINQITLAKRPKFMGQVPDTISGAAPFSGALFDNTISNSMYGDSYGLPVSTEPRSIFIVCMPTSINNEMVVMSYGGVSSGEFGLSLNPGGNVGSIQFTSGVANGRRDITAPIHLKPFIFGFTYDTAADISSANAKLFLNDKELPTTATSGGSGTGVINTTADTPLFIGSRGDASPYARLYIAEMIVVDGLVTQDEKHRIEAYLANEYNIQYNIGGHYYKSTDAEEEIENLFPNNTFAGATVGVLGSGGSLPTGFSVNWASQITEVISITEDNGVAKMRISITANNTTGAAVHPGIKCPITAGISPGAYGLQWKYGRFSKTGTSSLTEGVNFKCKNASNVFISDAYLNTYSVPDPTVYSKASRMAILPAGTASLDFVVATQLNNTQDISWVFDISAIQVERESLSDKLIPTNNGSEFGTGIWTPAKLGADNLGWFSAKDRGNISLISGMADKWISRSGAVVADQIATASQRPEYREAGLSGLPSMYFDNDLMHLTQGLTSWPSGAADDEITVVIVARPHSSGSGSIRTAFYYGNNSTGGQINVSSGSLGEVHVSNGSSTKNYTGTSWFDDASVVIVEAGTYVASYKDGNPLQAANFASVITSTKYATIGRDYGSYYWIGDICEILVIGRRLNAEERSKLEIYAATEWGIRSKLYGDHYTNVVAIIDGLRDSNPNIDITLQNMNPMGVGAGRAMLNDMYEVDRNIANAKNCRFLDNFSAWVDYLGQSTLTSENSIGGDFTHPTETLINEVLVTNQYKHFSNVLAGTIEIGELRFLAGQLFIGNYVVAEPVVHGAKNPTTVTITAGTIPAGLTFTDSGQLVGVLTTAGTYVFTITCADFAGVTTSKEFSIVVESVSATLTTRAAAVSTSTSGNLSKPAGLEVDDVVFVVAEYTGSSGLTVQTTGGDVWSKQVVYWPTLGYYSSIHWKVITSTDLANNWSYSNNAGYRIHVAGFDVNGAVINGFNVKYFGGTTGNSNVLDIPGFVKTGGSKFLLAAVVDRDNNNGITLPEGWTRYDDSLMAGSTFTTRVAFVPSSNYVNGDVITFGSLAVTWDQIGFLIEVY